MILLTGAPGWLGNRFLELFHDKKHDGSLWPGLAEYGKIRCLLLPGLKEPDFGNFGVDVEFCRGDITDENSLENFFRDSEGALLIHLAGIIHPHLWTKYFYEVNLKGTKNVLQAAHEHGVGKLILMSSNSQSGFNDNNRHRFDEASPYHPYMNYGRSKMLMEIAAEDYGNRYGMDITIMRTCWFYGPHQPERQTKFFRMIKAGRFPVVGDGTNIRSLSYVDDICLGIALIAATPKSKGKTYWIADKEPYSMNQIMTTVAEVLENDFNIKVKSPAIKVPGIIGDIASVADCLLQASGLYVKEMHVLSEMNKNIACKSSEAFDHL